MSHTDELAWPAPLRQAEKKMEMERTLQNWLPFFPIKFDCTSDDAFGPGLAMENTLLCGLTAALVRDGWTVFEGNLAVQGGISQWQEGTPTEAVSFVRVLHAEALQTQKVASPFKCK